MFYRHLYTNSIWRMVSLALAATLFIGAGYEKERGAVSWYSTEACQYNPHPGCPTADGTSLYALEREGVLFAAKWGVPFGSRYRVCSTSSGRCVVVEIRDRGPARRLNRKIDLSKKAFSHIAPLSEGLVDCSIRRLT